MSSRHSNDSISVNIKAEAINLGFFACGIARAEPVDSRTASHVRRWLDSGGNAGMTYMGNHTDKRLDPRLLVPGVKSIVCVALGYAPAVSMAESEYRLSAYAYGQDYHDIMKDKLHRLAKYIDELFASTDGTIEPQPAVSRTFCDTAPVLERYWAERAGLGWIGRNHQLIIPGAGSMFFLGELFVDRELDYDSPCRNRCGNCHACIDACPTHALADGCEIDAGRCLSYQTIENRGPIPPDIAAAMDGCIYGCDHCQTACPWNRFSPPATEPAFHPREELLRMKKEDWLRLTEDEYRRLFKGSAVKRAKYAGLMRNIRAAHDNDR